MNLSVDDGTRSSWGTKPEADEFLYEDDVNEVNDFFGTFGAPDLESSDQPKAPATALVGEKE